MMFGKEIDELRSEIKKMNASLTRLVELGEEREKRNKDLDGLRERIEGLLPLFMPGIRGIPPSSNQ